VAFATPINNNRSLYRHERIALSVAADVFDQEKREGMFFPSNYLQDSANTGRLGHVVGVRLGSASIQGGQGLAENGGKETIESVSGEAGCLIIYEDLRFT
jgi:hypothetical protein